jgi:hypothetical protein
MFSSLMNWQVTVCEELFASPSILSILQKSSTTLFRPTWRNHISHLLTEISRWTRNDKNVGVLTPAKA